MKSAAMLFLRYADLILVINEKQGNKRKNDVLFALIDGYGESVQTGVIVQLLGTSFWQRMFM